MACRVLFRRSAQHPEIAYSKPSASAWTMVILGAPPWIGQRIDRVTSAATPCAIIRLIAVGLICFT